MMRYRIQTRTVFLSLATLGFLSLLGLSGVCHAITTDAYHLPEGETHQGNIYLFSEVTDIDGMLDGDLIAFTRYFTLDGTITDDLFLCSQTVEIAGTVGDSMRACGQFLTVTGTIDGDLVAFGQTVTLAPGARVGGDLISFGAELVIDGDVQGRVKAWAGDAFINGTVGKKAQLKCDTVTVGSQARIGGDFVYTARREVDLDGMGIVGGRIEFNPLEEDEEQIGSGAAFLWRVLWQGGFWFGALIVGILAIALFRGPSMAIAGSVGTDTLRSLGVGFLVAIVTPIAGVILMILVLTIPLAFLLMGLFLMAVYLAKLPVALWLGGGILSRFGHSRPSPYGALVLGLLVLYLVFLIPYVGLVVWVACLLVGLGALLLGTAGLNREGKPSPVPAPGPAN